MEKHGDDPEVCRQVEALIGSVGDTLSDEIILEELKALKKSGMPFQKVFGGIFRTKITPLAGA